MIIRTIFSPSSTLVQVLFFGNGGAKRDGTEAGVLGWVWFLGRGEGRRETKGDEKGVMEGK